MENSLREAFFYRHDTADRDSNWMDTRMGKQSEMTRKGSTPVKV